MLCCSAPSRDAAPLELVHLPPCIVTVDKTKLRAQPGKFLPVRPSLSLSLSLRHAHTLTTITQIKYSSQPTTVRRKVQFHGYYKTWVYFRWVANVFRARIVKLAAFFVCILFTTSQQTIPRQRKSANFTLIFVFIFAFIFAFIFVFIFIFLLRIEKWTR